MISPASDEAFRKAWETEIEIGVQRGKLTQSSGKADLKTAPMPVEEHDSYKDKYQKG